MYIKQVIIRGFKTYKDQTNLAEDFSPGTNVVVGFNGAGKSNFFQAILFVLSDQYSSLRAETRRALLHEGAGQAVLTAYVEVILDNSDRRILVDSDQVSIRRLIGVKKDDWLIDGRHSTKAEIFGLLEGAGFAKTSPYYIVQQGKVSELTLMSDLQRLGMLKDISGAGVYDERRAESVKIMEDTALRRTRAEGLIAEIEGKLSALEGEQRELRECERMEARRRTLEYVLGDREWRSTQSRLDELAGKHSEASAVAVEFQNRVSALRKKATDAEADLQRKEETRAKLAESLTGLETERDRKFEALTKARLQADDEATRQRESEEASAACLAEVADMRTKLAAATEQMEVARSDVGELQKTLRDLDQRCQVASAKRENLLAQKGRRSQYTTVEERNAALDEEIRRRTVKVKEGKRALETCDQKMQRCEERSAKAKGEVVERRQELEAVEQQLAELSKGMRTLGEQLEGDSERLRLLHQERSKVIEDVERSQHDAVKFQHRLEATLPRSYRLAISAVMQWAEDKGMGERVFGPVLHHIEVPTAFRCAVETFAGMALFNILASDDEVAAQAVKLVRTRRLGAVVVTPLSQLRLKDFAPVKMEGVKSIVDIISCPDWARPAVQQIFGRAVVCRSMELCEEVARVYGVDAITMEGDRFSRKGVVTGGYQDPGRCQRLALAESIRAAHKQLAAAQARLPEAEAQIQSTSQQLDGVHAERKARQEERDRVRAQMQQLAEQAQGLEETISKSVRDINDLTEWRHRMEVMIGESEASIEAKKAERETTALNGLSPADEQALAELTSEVDELTASLESARATYRAQVTTLQEKDAQIESYLRPRLREAEKQVASGTRDDALDRAEEAAQTRSRLEREHRECCDGADTATRQLQALVEECQQAKAAMEEQGAEEQQLQEQAAQASVRVDQLDSEMASLKEKKAEIDERMQKLTAPVAEVEKCKELPKAQLVRELGEVGRELQAFQHVNRKAVEQYENFSEQLSSLRQRKEEIEAGEAAIAEAMQKIDEQKESTILQTLKRVNEHFQQVFSEMVPGGAGKLRVVRQAPADKSGSTDASLTAPSAGDASQAEAGDTLGELVGVKIEVSFVAAQANSFLVMNQLSGGQKTVVALSLIFAIQRLEPAPFYLLDEVDAALDASYRSALANLVAKTAKTSQVVLTTFRPEVLDKASRCYRVYQQNRASRIDVITCEQAKQVLREQDRLDQAAAAMAGGPVGPPAALAPPPAAALPAP